MIKRFCDRCGAETDINNTHIRVKPKKSEFWLEIWLEKFSGNTAFNTKADLCENCVKSLKNWFMGGR